MSDSVFFYKAAPHKDKPWRLDLLDICVAEKKIFMPYAIWLPTVRQNQSWLRPPNDYPTDLCTARHKGMTKVKMETQATGLINNIDSCLGQRWVVIPRVGTGFCWLAEIPKGNQYRSWPKSSPWIRTLGRHLGKWPTIGPDDQYVILADAAQGWETTPWKKVSFASLPRWFSKQFFQRSSFGEIHGLPPCALPAALTTSPAAVSSSCFSAPTGRLPPLANSLTPNDVLKRMIDRLSPTALEFLCVELLNVKILHDAAFKKMHPCVLWMHVGGVGDGGVDGIGFDSNGDPIEFLSVKWEINPSILIPPHATKVTHLAYLVASPKTHHPGTTVVHWGPGNIAQDLITHAAHLSTSFRALLGI